MNALARFRTALPTWRPSVEAWLDDLPASVRIHPARAALAYLFAAPSMRALGADHLANLESGWIDWGALEQRAVAAGEVERAILVAASSLARGDPGPALGLMLLFPDVEAFHWVYAAGTVHELVSERLHRHAFALR